VLAYSKPRPHFTVAHTADDNKTLPAVVTDCFDWTAFHRFLAKGFLFRRRGLFVDVGMPAIIVAFEIGRSRFPAEIAIDALFIDVEFSGNVLGVFSRSIRHDSPGILGKNGEGATKS
jgi:hypothetical protein